MTLFQSALTIMQTGPLLLCGFLAMVLGAARKKIAAAIERRRVRSALGKLDDYMLKDMGISRSDIERISNRTYPPLIYHHLSIIFSTYSTQRKTKMTTANTNKGKCFCGSVEFTVAGEPAAMGY